MRGDTRLGAARGTNSASLPALSGKAAAAEARASSSVTSSTWPMAGKQHAKHAGTIR
jgi:hypothetical protein